MDIFQDIHSVHLHHPGFYDFINKVNYNPNNEYCNIKSNDERLEFFSNYTRERSGTAYHSARSFFVKKRYTAESFNEAQNILMEMPASTGGLFINSEQGAIGNHQSNESAYVHRDAIFSFKVYYEARNEQDYETSKDWMDRLYESVKFMDSGETYQNYPERGINLRRYYGSNLERLIDIKNKWDPNQYFDLEMSLPKVLPETLINSESCR